MAVPRILWLAAAVFVLLVTPAQAADVLVLGSHGRTVERSVPGIASRGPERPTRQDRSVRATASAGSALAALKDLAARDRIEPEVYTAYRKVYNDAVAFTAKLSGRRLIEMRGQLAVLNAIAARGQLTASRVTPLFVQLARNREWWNTGPLLATGARVSFKGSQVIYQYFPGEGLQFHPLANFGVLNGEALAHVHEKRMTQMLEELLPMGAHRAGGIAWEYYFDFDGGSPPWVSSLSQGTALQGLARASKIAGTYDVVIPLLDRALTIFHRAPPAGVRVPADGGIHYVQYSFAPALRILNGFVQSLTGLFDYAKITGSTDAAKLFAEGDVAARKEVPTFDTGAWSLYSRGSIARESNLEYHELLTLFLNNLCDRTGTDVYCRTAKHFEDDEKQPPVLRLLTTTVHRGRPNALLFRLSKISSVHVTLTRGGQTVLSYGAVLGYGTRSVTVTPPAGARRYDVSISATDLAGNSGSTSGTVKIVK